MSSKAKKKRKVSEEPVLQDFTVTSFSDLRPDVSGPSDSTIFEEIKDYSVELAQTTFNKTADINISTGPYPSDSSLDSLFKQHSDSKTDSKAHRPLQRRAKTKSVQEDLFASCLESFSDCSPEKVKPLQRRNKNQEKIIMFDSLLESNTPSKDSPFKKPLQRLSKNKKKVNLFDSLEKDSQPNTPDVQTLRPLQRKSKKKISSHYFEEVFSNDSIDVKTPLQNFITRRQSRKKKCNESSMFGEDLESSQSDVSMSVQVLKNRPASNHNKNSSEMFDDILDDTNFSVNNTPDNKSHNKSSVINPPSQSNVSVENNTKSFNLEYIEDDVESLEDHNMLVNGQSKSNDADQDEEKESTATSTDQQHMSNPNDTLEKGSPATLTDQQHMSNLNNTSTTDENHSESKSSFIRRDSLENEEGLAENKEDFHQDVSKQQDSSLNNKKSETIEKKGMTDSVTDESLSESTMKPAVTVNVDSIEKAMEHEVENLQDNHAKEDTLSNNDESQPNIGEALTEESLKCPRVSVAITKTPESLKSLCDNDLAHVRPICTPDESFKDMPSSTPNVKGKRVSFSLKPNISTSTRLDVNNINQNQTLSTSSTFGGDYDMDVCQRNDMTYTSKKILKGHEEKSVTDNKPLATRKSSLRFSKGNNYLKPVNSITESSFRKRRVSFKIDSKKISAYNHSNTQNDENVQNSNQSDDCHSSISLEPLVYEAPSGSGTPVSESFYIDIHPSRSKSTSDSNTGTLCNIKSIADESKSLSKSKRSSKSYECEKTYIFDEKVSSVKEYKENKEEDLDSIDGDPSDEENETSKLSVDASHVSTEKESRENDEEMEIEEDETIIEEAEIEEDEENYEDETEEEEIDEDDVREGEEVEETEMEGETDEEKTEGSGGFDSTREQESQDEEDEETEKLNNENHDTDEAKTEGSGGFDSTREHESLEEEDEEIEKDSNENPLYKEFVVNNTSIVEQDENVNPAMEVVTGFKVPLKVPKQNKKLRTSSLFREKLIEVPSKSQLQDILNKIPFSELKKRKKRKSNEHCISKEQMQQFEIEEELLRNQQQKKTQQTKTFSASNKLKRPKKWVSPKLYDFLISKLKPKYGIRSRIRAEELVLFLVQRVEVIKKKEELVREDVDEMKIELASLGVVKTHWDFYKFVNNLCFDRYFKEKMYPSTPGLRSAFDFGPANVMENIIYFDCSVQENENTTKIPPVPLLD